LQHYRAYRERKKKHRLLKPDATIHHNHQVLLFLINQS
jgi:hypothetical protein